MQKSHKFKCIVVHGIKHLYCCMKSIMILTFKTTMTILLNDIQDYYDYIIKKHDSLTNILWTRIYITKIKKRITFKI